MFQLFKKKAQLPKRIPYFQMTQLDCDDETAGKLIDYHIEKFGESFFLEMAEHEKTYHTSHGYVEITASREPNENECKVINTFLNADKTTWETFNQVRDLLNENSECNLNRSLLIDFMYAKFAQDRVYMKDKMYDQLSPE